MRTQASTSRAGGAPASTGDTREDPPVAAVLAARRGDHGAFEYLAHVYGAELHRFLVVRLANDADARDALQETFVAAWTGISRLRRPARVRSWFFGFAAKKAADVNRTRGRLREVPLAARTHRDSNEADGPAIVTALAALPAGDQDILLLRYWMGFSEREIASALGVRVGTVKSRSSRARRRMLDSLAS